MCNAELIVLVKDGILTKPYMWSMHYSIIFQEFSKKQNIEGQTCSWKMQNTTLSPSL